MSGGESEERRARVALSFLADPGDVVLGAALQSMTAAEVLAAATGTDGSGEARLTAVVPGPALEKALRRWRMRLGQVPTVARLAAWQEGGLRLVVPGEPEWPSQLDDLGDARPLLLWLRGAADLRFACLNSVAIVGARAATGYGNHVGLQIAASLAERGLTVISGGAKATNCQQRSPRMALAAAERPRANHAAEDPEDLAEEPGGEQ